MKNHNFNKHDISQDERMTDQDYTPAYDFISEMHPEQIDEEGNFLGTETEFKKAMDKYFEAKKVSDAKREKLTRARIHNNAGSPATRMTKREAIAAQLMAAMIAAKWSGTDRILANHADQAAMALLTQTDQDPK